MRPSGSRMCTPSIVADDWIVKGFHIHVNGIELVVRPDHAGGVKFLPVFGPMDNEIRLAINLAIEECLPKAGVRKKWLDSVERATLHLISQRGELRDLALGRMAEMKFLRIALERYRS